MAQSSTGFPNWKSQLLAHGNTQRWCNAVLVCRPGARVCRSRRRTRCIGTKLEVISPAAREAGMKTGKNRLLARYLVESTFVRPHHDTLRLPKRSITSS